MMRHPQICRRTIQLLCDHRGHTNLGDVRQAATAVDVMDARGTAPRVGRGSGWAGALATSSQLLLCPGPFAGLNESGGEPVA